MRQFGLYPLWALEGCEGLPLVREDRGGPTSGVPVVDEALPGSYVGKGEPLKASKRETLLQMSLLTSSARREGKTPGRTPGCEITGVYSAMSELS